MHNQIKTKLNNLLKFADFLADFRQVERVIYAKNIDRLENDVEHSYNLAMLAWYLVESQNLNLDIKKVLQYTLIHDLVETYAGDTYFYSQNKKEVESKKNREQQALFKIQKQFPEINNITKLMQDYENKATPESRFVFALDKLEPIITILLDGGGMWNKKKVSVEILDVMKRKKVELDETVLEYFEAMLDFLRKNKKELFNFEKNIYVKDFDNWNTRKKEINKKEVSNQEDFFFHEKEVWWSALGVNIGIEMDGKNNNFERPILILRKINNRQFYGAPITSQEKKGKFYVDIGFGVPERKGKICLSQIKVFDSKRLLRKIGNTRKDNLNKIKKEFTNFISGEYE